MHDPTDKIFPLALKPFEELFLHQDQPPNWPATMALVVRVSGKLEERLAEAALEHVSNNQPLLRSVVDVDASGKFFWQQTDRSPESTCVQATESGESPSKRAPNFWRPFDLRTEPPLRLQLVAGTSQSTVKFNFHHAAVDGIGALQIASEWMVAYDKLFRGQTLQVCSQSQNAQMLERRCGSNLRLREMLRLARWHWLSLFGVANFLLNKPIPLKLLLSPVSERQRQAYVPRIETRRLSINETESLKKTAIELGATVNDLLVLETMRAIRAWQREHSTGQGTHLRVSIPINERTIRRRRLPACNHCTIVSLDRRPQQLDAEFGSAEYRRLIAELHREIRLVRDWRLGLMFWRGLRVRRFLPGGIKRSAISQTCESTCLLTNLGEMEKRLRLAQQHEKLVFGEYAIECLDLIAPMRYGTNISICASYYRQQLCLTMQWDTSVLTQEEASELLDLLVTNLLQIRL